MKRRIWEIAVVCLFCILEVGAASFLRRQGRPQRELLYGRLVKR